MAKEDEIKQGKENDNIRSAIQTKCKTSDHGNLSGIAGGELDPLVLHPEVLR